MPPAYSHPRRIDRIEPTTAPAASCERGSSGRQAVLLGDRYREDVLPLLIERRHARLQCRDFQQQPPDTDVVVRMLVAHDAQDVTGRPPDAIDQGLVGEPYRE